MKAALVILLVVHGAIHFIGVAKGYRFGPLWGAIGLALLASAVMLAMSSQWWWAAAALAIACSQLLIATSWKDAKVGTVANVLILVPVVLTALELRASSLTSIYRAEVERGLARPVSDYRELGGFRIAAKGDAIWRRPQGDFTYGRFEVVDIRFDLARPATAPGRVAQRRDAQRSAVALISAE